MALSHGREGVDNAGARNGAGGEDVDVRERHVLLFRRPELEEGRQRIPLGLQQTGGPTHHPAGHAQFGVIP